MVALGNFLFQHRNKLFPVFYVLLFLPSPSLTGNLGVVMILGFLIAVAGQVVRVATIGLRYIIRGGRRRRVYADDLVTDGIFGHCRNPLYVGNILILVGLGVMANSLVFNVVAAPLFLFMYQAIVRAEEDFLASKFGAGYREYVANVNRWIPRLGGLRDTFGSMEFVWRRVVIREYTTTYIWLTGAVLLLVKNLAQAEDDTLYRAIWPWAASALVALFAIYITIRSLKIRGVLAA